MLDDHPNPDEVKRTTKNVESIVLDIASLFVKYSISSLVFNYLSEADSILMVTMV